MTRFLERADGELLAIDGNATGILRPWVRVIGWSAALACIAAFSAYTVRHIGDIPWQVLLIPSHASVILVATALYVIAIGLNGCAWYVLVREPGGGNRIGAAVVVVLTAQFGKYIPGNVAQVAGRVVLARTYGFAVGRSVASTALESVLAIVAAVLVGGAALMSADWSRPEWIPVRWPEANVTIVAGVVVLAAIGALYVVRRPLFLRHELLARFDGLMPSAAGLAAALGFLIAVFVLVALALQLVVQYVFEVRDARFAWVFGSMAVAWVGGFLAPGVPGGLGVREALLAGMLAPAVGTGIAVGTALTFRLVTTLGDFVGFVAGVLGQRLLRRVT